MKLPICNSQKTNGIYTSKLKHINALVRAEE